MYSYENENGYFECDNCGSNADIEDADSGVNNE